ncbi:MAG TPA: adenylate/guanylate cyclase domain-containing protein [Lacunisphaera sp.]|nr:adenylate/guanylate cyclase domain-containing protein [Lacunisphaera sp.]
METTPPPSPVVSGQRQLAVIMFTDAVGYSARMHAQETDTLNLIERDTAVMRGMIEHQAGTVLKSTGDGLLIQFSSAVQAVACAQEIQRAFAGPADPAQAKSALRYRIGIHLGDVFIGSGDVMGDGVNIAARLVTQAQPGGIVISQTVFDVVKNKLPLHTVRLGPQPLKNIKEPIVLYKVLLEAPPPAASATPATTTLSPSADEPAPRSRKPLIALVAVLGVIFAAKFLLQQQADLEDSLQRSQTDREAFKQRLEQSAVVIPGQPATPEKTPDFARLVTSSPANQGVLPDDAALRVAADRQTEVLFRWLAEDMKHYTFDRPLEVRSLGDASFRGATVFLGAKGELNFREGGAFRRQEWEKLSPQVQAAIIASALAYSPRPVSPEVRNGAAAFAYLHGLPEMIEALRR